MLLDIDVNIRNEIPFTSIIFSGGMDVSSGEFFLIILLLLLFFFVCV